MLPRDTPHHDQPGSHAEQAPVYREPEVGGGGANRTGLVDDGEALIRTLARGHNTGRGNNLTSHSERRTAPEVPADHDTDQPLMLITAQKQRLKSSRREQGHGSPRTATEPSPVPDPDLVPGHPQCLQGLHNVRLRPPWLVNAVDTAQTLTQPPLPVYGDGAPHRCLRVAVTCWVHAEAQPSVLWGLCPENPATGVARGCGTALHKTLQNRSCLIRKTTHRGTRLRATDHHDLHDHSGPRVDPRGHNIGHTSLSLRGQSVTIQRADDSFRSHAREALLQCWRRGRNEPRRHCPLCWNSIPTAKTR